MRDSELHLGSFSEFKKSSENINDVFTERVVKEKTISDFSNSENVKVRAFIVQSFEPRFFYICPECKKKVSTDGENYICLDHGKVISDKRALMNVVLDDGTDTIRAVLFNDVLALVGLTNLNDLEKTIYQREDLLGKEFVFYGQIRNNKFFNESEFIIEKVENLDIDKLVVELENKK